MMNVTRFLLLVTLTMLSGCRALSSFAGIGDAVDEDEEEEEEANEDTTSFFTCLDVATCVSDNGEDDSARESCLASASSAAASEYRTVDDCFSSCTDDESCERTCLPLSSECLCGAGSILADDDTGRCDNIADVTWQLAVTSADVADLCGDDGFGLSGDEEIFNVVSLDLVVAFSSGFSGCDAGFANWPASDTWAYEFTQVFTVDIFESDVFSDDLFFDDIAFRDANGEPAPIPTEILLLGAWGEVQTAAGQLELFVDR